ncbi:hypothetical protein LINGRAHAP2_LOCUS30576, partial [Linum grandiflorum]
KEASREKAASNSGSVVCVKEGCRREKTKQRQQLWAAWREAAAVGGARRRRKAGGGRGAGSGRDEEEGRTRGSSAWRIRERDGGVWNSPGGAWSFLRRVLMRKGVSGSSRVESGGFGVESGCSNKFGASPESGFGVARVSPAATSSPRKKDDRSAIKGSSVTILDIWLNL